MRRTFGASALCLLLLASAHAQIAYDGEFCEGVVDFPLKSDTNVAELDAAAADFFSAFPRWVAKVRPKGGTHKASLLTRCSFSPVGRHSGNLCA